MPFMKTSHFLYSASAGINSDLYSAPLSNRILQEYRDSASSSRSGDLVMFTVGIGMFFFLFVCIQKARGRLAPSSEILSEQRRRQRELIRQARRRNMNIDPDTMEEGRINMSRADHINIDQDTINSRSIELSASEKEKRRSQLLRRFKANNVQTTIKEDSYIGEQISGDPESGENPRTVNKSMVQLPNRKSPQPDAVPNICAICLDSYEVGDVIVWSENEVCRHAFHQDCIADCLVPLENVGGEPCPCCRQPFCIGSEPVDP